jgi:hypothetical protein
MPIFHLQMQQFVSGQKASSTKVRIVVKSIIGCALVNAASKHAMASITFHLKNRIRNHFSLRLLEGENALMPSNLAADAAITGSKGTLGLPCL